jgi:hypothetical protein
VSRPSALSILGWPAGGSYRGAMRRTTTVLLAALALLSTWLALPAAATAHRSVCTGGARELFCDDFTGTTLDAGKWDPTWLGSPGPVNDAESACYSPSHVSVHDGVLDLHITATSSTCKNKTRPETTGIVTTAGHFMTPTTNYRVIWRAYFPAAANGQAANWSVVWDNGLSWPSKGESDVAEVLSGHVCATYHSSSGAARAGCADLTGWHTFREDVVGTKVTYFYDKTQIGQVTAVEAPHYLVAGEQGSGSIGGPRVDGVSLLVQWVKVKRL